MVNMTTLGKSRVQETAVVIDLCHVVSKENDLLFFPPSFCSPVSTGKAWRFVACLTPCKHYKHRKVGGLPVSHLQAKATCISWNAQL